MDVIPLPKEMVSKGKTQNGLLLQSVVSRLSKAGSLKTEKRDFLEKWELTMRDTETERTNKSKKRFKKKIGV